MSDELQDAMRTQPQIGQAMTFTSTPPTEPGFYAMKYGENSSVFPTEVYKGSDGYLYYGKSYPLNNHNELFWCRLYPSDELVPKEEVEKAFREGHAAGGIDIHSNTDKDWLSSRARKVVEEGNSIVKTLKEQLSALQQQVKVLREALQPFGSGIDIIQWGMIKASIPEAAARKLTRYNCVADNALALTNPAVEP